MKNIFKGLLLSALFVPLLTGCGDGSKEITIHTDVFYMDGMVKGDVYIAQGLESPRWGETVTYNTRVKSITMKVQNNWTYREVYLNHLFFCRAAYVEPDTTVFVESTIFGTRYGLRVYFADTQKGLDDVDYDWTKKITGNDLWIGFAKPVVE